MTARHREDEGSPSSDEIATRLEEANVNVPTCREGGKGYRVKDMLRGPAFLQIRPTRNCLGKLRPWCIRWLGRHTIIHLGLPIVQQLGLPIIQIWLMSYRPRVLSLLFKMR